MIVGSSMSAEPVGYGAPLAMIEAMSHGQPRPSRMLKTFEPSTLHTAMLPCPLRATRMEESASGTEVPAARMVRPMRNSGIWRMQPARAAKSTMRKERRPIHMMDMVKVMKYHVSHFSLRQSGMVNSMQVASGQEMMSRTLPTHVCSSSSSGSSAGLGGGGAESATMPEPRDERDLTSCRFALFTFIAVTSIDFTCPCWTLRAAAVRRKCAGLLCGTRSGLSFAKGVTLSSLARKLALELALASALLRYLTILSLTIIVPT
mmetsp:Transcript_43932/g.93500  ORF Transcript_43932/g.93500 Transcript_43932/m.93500 type:complete len:261 (-) Transcript_43932:818-1600(-)